MFRKIVKEPPRIADLSALDPWFRQRVERVLDKMRAQGFDPVVYETLRTPERQAWLYGIGRTHSLDRKPVTWTMKSKHLVGRAADIISKSRGWDHPAFFAALRKIAREQGLKTLNKEFCHIEG